MPVHRRSSPPPYQVMKPHPPTSGLRPGGAAPGTAGGGAAAGGAGTPAGGRLNFEHRVAGWLHSLQNPLAMRISQGMALVLIWAVLVIVFLAYWVGHHRGFREGLEETRHDASGLIPGVPGPAAAVAPGSGGVPGPMVDPRQPGLSYYLVASLPARAKPAVARKEAHDLVLFLQSKGVDAAAILPHNGGFYEVAVLEAFPPGETDGPAAQQRGADLRRLGFKNLLLKRQKKSDVVDDLISKENIQ
jgi:hypothetical protein